MFAERLNTAMRIRHMRNRDIVKKAKELGYSNIGSNAVSQWTTGKFEPKQDKLVILARILDVSELYLMGLTDEMQGDAVTATEMELLSCFRSMNSDGKEALLSFAKIASESKKYSI